MTALRQEALHYIEDMPEAKLEEACSLLRIISSKPERMIFVADLTDEERAMIAADYEEFKAHPENFTELN